MRILAPAKVNLFLGVGAARADGYHAVTTVMHALELSDEVRLEPSTALELEGGDDLGIAPEMNLAHRAAVAFADAVGRAPSVRIVLDKRIPHGAGLGGGSSDAAAVIAGLAALWQVPEGDHVTVKVAASLGADVPFFLAGTPAALLTGRGDVLERTLPGAPGVPVAVVKPPDPVRTVAAYRAFDAAPEAPGGPDAVLRALGSGDHAALAAALANNLERASATVVPSVGEALTWVAAQPGVRGATVAGSGSAVFAVCEDDRAAAQVAGSAMHRGWWGVATRLGSHAVRVTTG